MAPDNKDSFIPLCEKFVYNNANKTVCFCVDYFAYGFMGGNS